MTCMYNPRVPVESRLNMQTAYDLWRAEKKHRPKITPMRETVT